MPSQRPFFLSTFFAAFRQQPPSALSSTAQQASKSSSTATASYSSAAASNSRSITTASASSAQQAATQRTTAGGIAGQLPLHSPRGHATIPIPVPGRRRGSNSSSEGYREVVGADKWYIGGRTATGEEKFFKLGVIRRVRSGDRLSLDRLSL